MDTTESILEPLLEKAVQYGQTSLALLKLEAQNKLAAAMGLLARQLFIAVIAVAFLCFASIALALWLGHLWGQPYYGFLIVAAVHGLLLLLLLLMPNAIKKRVSNTIITQLMHA
jgi:uncharacterized membrane protein YagU involved in acid resistance